MKLPTEDSERAKYPLHDFDNFFPNARRAKARHSYESNVKHCGEGEPMKWAKDKSIGDGNQIKRHLDDYSEALRANDPEEILYHLTAHAWRADELLERYICKMEPFNEKQEDMPASGQNSRTSNKPMSYPAWLLTTFTAEEDKRHSELQRGGLSSNEAMHHLHDEYVSSFEAGD